MMLFFVISVIEKWVWLGCVGFYGWVEVEW